ncbi:MAG: ketoacyl-ACP synthase III [Planctomycetes bacterium]|nr:ketoacyl-ACP synthase III [Planctomycetota bacterium]
MYSAYFAGTGAALPERVLTNSDLEKMVDTSDEWILQRTGIRQRRIAAEGQNTSDLAAGAARRALESAKVAPGEIDAVIVATVTGDTVCPAVSVYVQAALGARNSCAFDLSAACTGFVYGTAVAASFVQSGFYQNVLLIGAETLSRFVDFTDRSSCILFGDGAGAAVISRVGEGGSSRIIDSLLRADGTAADLISIPAGGSRLPASHQTVEQRQHFLQLQGKEVFKFATKAMVDLIETALIRNRLSMADLQLIIPHQVNYRIIEAALKKLELPEERLYLNLDRYGNTSAASVPIALSEACQEGRLKRGDLVLLVAFGAGMTWGYNLVRW